MANPNLSQKQRIICYPRLQKLWPEICSCCQKTLDELNLNPFDPETGIGGYEIHHTSYQWEITDPQYQRFMCHGCNHKVEFSRATIMAFETEISASHKANIQKHPIFLDWFSNAIRENNFHLPLSEVINGGSHISGANVKTVRGWLLPLAFWSDSPFSVVNISGIDTIYLRGKESRLNLPSRDIKDFNHDVDQHKK